MNLALPCAEAIGREFESLAARGMDVSESVATEPNRYIIGSRSVCLPVVLVKSMA